MGRDDVPTTSDELQIALTKLFKPWIVVRRGGQDCQVLLPLSELDAIVREMIRQIGQAIAESARKAFQ